MKNIKYGYIAPIKYQHLIPKSADFHLILAHLLDNREYVDFYKEKIKRGDTVILDNSAFEFKRALSAEEIFGFIERSGIEPTYVVAPDYPYKDWKVTWNSTLAFIEEVKGKPYKVMAVPQSLEGDWTGWLRGYTEMVNHPDIAVIGMSIIGIPNAFCKVTGTSDIAFNRIYATNYLLNTGLANRSKWHHYLGLGGGPREIVIQRQLGLMDSNDSSSPFWHGYLGKCLDDSIWGLEHGKSTIEVDFHAPYEMGKVGAIQKNVDYMQSKILG
tara:strand:+ start:172 stop:981 length:810 start_codon:yes stop_codon:yes gene_type:complete